MQALAKKCSNCSCPCRQSKGWYCAATFGRGEAIAAVLLVWGLSLCSWHYREDLKAFGVLGLFQFLLY